MSTSWIFVSVLLVILPPESLSESVKTTCEIPSVESGDNATLTIRFGHDLTHEESILFIVTHLAYNATVPQEMLSCYFTKGNVTCLKRSCCTWESHVTDVFRVYIHNVSQELEGKFWGFVIPADKTEQKYCNFTLKASTCSADSINMTNSLVICSNHSIISGQSCTVTCSPGFHFPENLTSVMYTCIGKNKWSTEMPAISCETFSCPTDSINATNSHMTCSNQSVTIGQTCTVTCSPGHYFQENHNFVKYTCVGKNEWSPENNMTHCKEQAEGQKRSYLYSLFLLLLIPIVFVIFFFCYRKRQIQRKEHALEKRKRKEGFTSIELSKRLTPLEEVQSSWKCRHYIMAQKELTNYWIECIRKWYHELQSRTHFLPPLPSNYGQSSPQTSQDCDGRDDKALKRVLLSLRALADNSQDTDTPQENDNPEETDKLQQPWNPQSEEIMMVISQLPFGKYIGQPSYAAAVVLSPLYSKLSGLSQQHYDKGDCDVLIIHKTLGLLTLQITSVGENFSQLEMTEQEQDDVVMKKVKEAVEQLNKADAVLKHLTSDIADITHITKILVLPNISSSQLLRAINRIPSDGQLLCECLGAKSVGDAVKLCLLKDQLSDNQTPSDINLSSIQALREWWEYVRVSRSGLFLKSTLYEKLVTRFCGPATTVEVHCVTAPRLNIRTQGEAVSETGERVARLVLFPQQVDILNQSPPQAFLSGPPGTGKTIVLIMQGLTWMHRGHDVHVVSTCDESRAVTIAIEHQLQETAKTSTARSRVHRHQFDFKKDGEVEIAVSRLKSESEGRQLCVIADEVVRRVRKSFTEFCDQLINEVPGVFIWGASLYHQVRPLCLKEVKLTTPLRSPPVVVREVMEAIEIMNKQVDDYTVNYVPIPTDTTSIIRIIHHKGRSGHTRDRPRDCVKCGHEVARVLTELDVGQTGDSNGPPPLQYRDILVLCYGYVTEDRVYSNVQVTTTASGLVLGLRDSLVPVRVVKEGDEADIRDTALGVSDLVTVANWDDVRGLERKVVVVESGLDVFIRLRAMSRCTSQLVVIDY